MLPLSLSPLLSPTPCSLIVCGVLASQEDSNTFENSSRERGPTTRALAGAQWQHFTAQKMVYALFPSGERKVLVNSAHTLLLSRMAHCC